MNLDIHQNYQRQAGRRQNQAIRQQKQTKDLLSFNNWIKSVLISEYSKQMCSKIEKVLDVPKGKRDPLLHVLDIGCGRGQDILKWKLARVRYMVASDFSDQCLRVYQQRWRATQPFRLHLVQSDFTKLDMYNKIQHSFYDMVSAQLCFHYMFKTKQQLNYGLANILSNLLIDGVFIATIPDSYSIVKKINQKGQKIDGFTYYGNKYFSLKFSQTKFTQQCGNQYGFYLQQAIGQKNKQTGQISYTNQWLISLDVLQSVLKVHGVQIQYTKNFIDFYMQFRDNPEYKKIFSKVGLIFDQGKCMDPDLWEIAHLYRVLVCRKKSKGEAMNNFTLDKRIKATKGKQIQRLSMNDSRSRGGAHSQHHNSHYNSHHNNHSPHNPNYNQNRNRPNYSNNKPYHNNNNNYNNQHRH